MSYTKKNYTEQGGERTVIGGTLEIRGKVVAGEEAEIIGIVTPCENMPKSSAATIAALKDDLNKLISSLKAAGLMEEDE